MEPLVEAFGYRNVRIEGYEADDVIASLAERALSAEPPVPVMIVTGDRDVFQLIDERRPREGDGDLAGDHRDEDLRPPGGDRPLRDPAGADPRLLRAEGRHLRQHPRRARDRRQDRERADPALRIARGGARHTSSEISGAKRKQNLLEHAEDARVSKRLATVQRDVAVELDIAAEAAREPDRSRVREVFREYELRDPLRRLEEALGDPEVAAPALAGRGQAQRRACAPARPPISLALAPVARTSSRVVVRETETPEGELFAEGPPWRFAAAARTGNGAEVLAGDCDGPEQVVEAVRTSAPSSRTTPRRSGVVPPGLAHDTLLGAYLLEPARRRYPVRRALRRARPRQRPRGSARRGCAAAARARRLAARADRRARPRSRDG